MVRQQWNIERESEKKKRINGSPGMELSPTFLISIHQPRKQKRYILYVSGYTGGVGSFFSFLICS